MSRSVRGLGPALLVLLSATPGAAMPAEETAPSFPADTGLVTVDVVVSDREGKPFHGLTREDFVVREDGGVQEITLFESIDRTAGPGGTAEGGPVASPVDSPALGALPAPARPVLLFVFDEPHLTPAGIERARRRLSGAAGSLGSVDLFLVSSERRGGYRLTLPADQQELAPALARFRGRRAPNAGGRMNDQEVFQIAARRDERALTQVFRRYLDQGLLLEHPALAMGRKKGSNELQMLSGGDGPTPALGRAAVQAEAELRWIDVRGRRAATLQGLTGLVRALAARRERKAVVLVSEGFVNDPAQPEHRELVEAARLAHAGIHFLDMSPGNPTSSHDTEMAETVDLRDVHETAARAAQAADGTKAVALATGGRVVHDSSGLAESLGRLAGGLRSYYLIGYSPQRPPDGRYHELKVDVRRAGLKVEARPGYYAVVDRRVADEEPAGGARAAAEAVALALDSPFDASELPVQLAAYVLGSKDGRSRVRLVAELGSPTPGTVDAVLRLTPRGRHETSERAFEALGAANAHPPLRLESDFEAPSGAYQAQVALRERSSGRLGSTRLGIEVLPDEAFRTSTPILTDTVVGDPPQVSPVARADRRFAREKNLYCYVEVGGASAAAPVLAGLELSEPSGTLRLRVPPSPLAAGQRSRLWALPLAGLEPGPYELRLTVQDTGTRQGLQRREAFEVVAGR